MKEERMFDIGVGGERSANNSVQTPNHVLDICDDPPTLFMKGDNSWTYMKA